MNPKVRATLEKKLLAKRLRMRSAEINPNYQDFELEPDHSKAFGFPDNSMVIDPEASILGEAPLEQKDKASNLGLPTSNIEQAKRDSGKVSSNLASDKYQATLAMGTSTGMIKIFSLKGYELEVYDAHDDEIIWVAFVPNKGLLVSIDVTNMLKLWDLKDLSNCEIQIQIPHPGNSRVSCLYVPSFLTTQPLNHKLQESKGAEHCL